MKPFLAIALALCCTAALAQRPGPRPDFDHHGWGGWGHVMPMPPTPYYQPNPFQYVAPIIANFATAPRSVVNPNNGIPTMMTPGYWAPPAGPGYPYTWVPTPIWPLTSKGVSAPPTVVATSYTAATVTAKHKGPIRRWLAARRARRHQALGHRHRRHLRRRCSLPPQCCAPVVRVTTCGPAVALPPACSKAMPKACSKVGATVDASVALPGKPIRGFFKHLLHPFKKQ